jgi:hypothetical protein
MHNYTQHNIIACVAVLILVALLGGCGPKPFAIADQKLCERVDVAGRAVSPKTVFVTTDPQVVYWFSYRGGTESMEVRAQFTYTDPLGNPAITDQTTTLKRGNGRAYATLKPLPDKGLALGTYKVELFRGEDVPAAQPLTFSVVQ